MSALVIERVQMTSNPTNRGSTVVFRGEFRVQADTPGRAGLFLRVSEGHAITGPMTKRSVFADPDNNITRSRTPATGRGMRSPRGY